VAERIESSEICGLNRVDHKFSFIDPERLGDDQCSLEDNEKPLSDDMNTWRDPERWLGIIERPKRIVIAYA
jgi:hypothetical protein